MSKKLMGIAMATIGAIFLGAEQGNCDSKNLFVCGVQVELGNNIDVIKRGFSKSCKTLEIDNNNLLLNDQNDNPVGSIFHQNKIVVKASRRWDSYAENKTDEIDALIDAIGSLRVNSDDVLKANLVVSERKDPTYITKELTIFSGGKRFTISTTRVKGIKGSSNFVNIDEQLE